MYRLFAIRSVILFLILLTSVAVAQYDAAGTPVSSMSPAEFSVYVRNQMWLAVNAADLKERQRAAQQSQILQSYLTPQQRLAIRESLKPQPVAIRTQEVQPFVIDEPKRDVTSTDELLERVPLTGQPELFDIIPTTSPPIESVAQVEKAYPAESDKTVKPMARWNESQTTTAQPAPTAATPPPVPDAPAAESSPFVPMIHRESFAPPPTATPGSKREFTIKERKNLGLSLTNVAATRKELWDEQDIDSESSTAEIAVAIGVRLRTKNPTVFKGHGPEQWESFLSLIERQLPLCKPE